MIFFVSDKKLDFTCKDIEQISVEDSLDLLNPLSEVGLDTETDGFSPYLKNLLSLQLGNFDNQVVIDCTTVDILKYKQYLESDRCHLGWNLKFDLKFLYHHGIIPRYVYDGFLIEKTLWQGYPSGMHSLSLKSAGLNYCGVELDKTIRGQIIWKGIYNPEVIRYAALDVKYLELIKEKQLGILKDRGLQRFIDVDIENRVLPAIAYFEYCGVKLDRSKWQLKMEKDMAALKDAETKLDSFILEYYNSNHPSNFPFIQIDTQGDLWSGFNDNPQCAINWNSTQQVIEVLEYFGFNLLTKDKKTGKLKKSVEASIIEKQKDVHPIADVYIKYKEAQKVCSTYGQNVLDLINPVTGRIHTNYNQIGTDTFRLSSGGGEDTEVIPGKKVPLINLQNMPANEETRSAFISEKGNRFISIDFTAEESLLLANISKDEAMLDLFINGCKDLHSLVAKMIYKDELKDIPVEQVKKKRPDLRKLAKSPEFAIAYGGDANTLANKDHIPIEEAQQIVDNYMKGFPGVAEYQKKQKKKVMELGYIDECPEVGYRTYIYDFQKLQDTALKFKEPGFWDKYRTLKSTNPTHPIVQEVRHYFKRKSATERQGVNYCIQSRGSAIFKIAAANFFNWIIKNDLFGKVKMCVPVHDEFCVEAPESIADEVALKLKECMVNAGKYICRLAPLDAEISYDKEGNLPTHWIH